MREEILAAIDKIEDEEIILLYLGYKNYLRSLNAIDFDDLLLEVYRLFIP